MNTEKVAFIRKLYPIGTRIQLDYMNDDYAPQPNTCGTVTGVDDMGTIHMNWDNGSSLGLIYGKDQFHKIE